MKNFISKIYQLVTSTVGVFIMLLVFMSFVAQSFVIPSGSMKNTLLIGDYLFVKKFSYGLPIPRIPLFEIPLFPDFYNNGHVLEGNGPSRGDIVVFRYPKNDKIHYVKRCIALGGDTVMIKDKKLLLSPKGGETEILKSFPKAERITYMGKEWVVNPYREQYKGIHNVDTVVQDGRNPFELFNTLPVVVPEGEFFMMGDNRDHSNDSRFWGTVPYKYIVGTPWFVWFSKDETNNIRWDRMFKSVETLQTKEFIKEENNHKEGIY